METAQINKICRACLRENADMIDTSKNDVHQKFLLFAGLNAEEELRNIPFNLCRSCEQKLNTPSSDFKMQCQNSHELLLNRVRKRNSHKQLRASKTRRFKCKLCNKRFNVNSKLIGHERVHTGEKPYACEVCGRSFALESSRSTHMKIHNVGSWISCDICSKKFARPYQFRLHLRIHTGEKPYVCAKCGKACVTKGNLAEHSKSHSDLRPYKCGECDKSFKKNDLLRRHMWIHSGEKPYKCTQCPYSCRQSTSLTKHMKRHEVDKPQADNPHVCLICNRTFSTDAMLMSHLHIHDVSFLEF